MKLNQWLCCLGAVLAVGGLDSHGGEPVLGARRSENFIVHDSRVRVPGTPLRGVSTNSAWVSFDVDGLTVSADRVRDSVSRELGFPMAGRTRSKIHLFLKRAVVEDQEIGVVSTFYTDGWQYRVWIPQEVERIKFVRGLVHVLLLEFANRQAGAKSAEIPLWLSEGLTHHLISSVGPNLIVDSIPTGSMLRMMQRLQGADPVRETRQFLASHQVLAFGELARPSVEQLSAENLELFQKSAHLFFYELMKLPRGKESVVAMLQTLPFCWNWETAFLHAFRQHFERLLDVEKWWSVNLAAMAGRDPYQVWSHESSLRKLDDILVAAAQIRLVTNALPVRTEVTLQQLIGDWDYRDQMRVIGPMIDRLTALRFSSPAGIIPLIDGYRICLRDYLAKRSEAVSGADSKLVVVPPVKVIVQETIRELDELYRQREALRRGLVSSAGIAE